MSDISKMHYAKLIGRSLLFIAALVMYIVNPIHIEGPLLGEVENWRRV